MIFAITPRELDLERMRRDPAYLDRLKGFSAKELLSISINGAEDEMIRSRSIQLLVTQKSSEVLTKCESLVKQGPFFVRLSCLMGFAQNGKLKHIAFFQDRVLEDEALVIRDFCWEVLSEIGESKDLALKISKDARNFYKGRPFPLAEKALLALKR